MPRQNLPIRRVPTGFAIRYRDPSGVQRQETLPTQRQARARLDEVRTQVRRGTFVDPALGQTAFGEFAARWAAGRDWKDSGRESWGYVSRRLDERIGPMPPTMIDRLVLEELQADLGRHYARRTVALTMSRARSVMRAAYATGRIGRDPTAGMAMPRRQAGDPDGRARPEDIPTRAEVLAVLAAAPSRFRAAIALGVTGLRVGEVIAVCSEQAQLDRRPRPLLVVDRQLQRIGGRMVTTSPKAEKVRTIVLPAAVAFELRRHLREHQGGGLLFRGQRGATLRRDTFYAEAWRPALVGAGLAPDRFVFHSLRHFAASQMLADGAPITAVAGHLGDTVETVQRTYAHWLRDDHDVPAAVLDRVLAPVEREAVL